MKFLTIKECHRELRNDGHVIGLAMLYRLAASGDIKLVEGRTDPAVLLETLRGLIASPAQPANQHQHNGCKSDEPLRLHGRKAVAQSSGRSRPADTAKQS